MAHYRIVRDAYSGYEVQSWRWWWPFWTQVAINTHHTVERAEEYAKRRAGGVVKYLGKLP